jgi:predicted alpha-1,6-mannanase (GH76 family)
MRARWFVLMILAGISSGVDLRAQQPSVTPIDRVREAIASLMLHYDPARGLWNTEGWWNAANSITEIGEAAVIDPGGKYSETLQTTFEKAQNAVIGDQGPNRGFLNQYYDDEGWWALAWVQAYDVTHRDAYLHMAESIFTNMSSGWDDTCGGGIWWKKDRHYKNAIANELFLSVASHLAARTRGSKRQASTQWATREWTWFSASGMINSEHLVNDGLTPDCRNNGHQTWTYNQGVVLGGLVELAHVTGDASLLAPANSIARATTTKLVDQAGVLHDKTEPKCSEDTVQFKGIFVRNLIALQKASPSNAFAAFIRANADAVWNQARTPENEFSCSWTGPPEARGAGATTSALAPLIGDAESK